MPVENAFDHGGTSLTAKITEHTEMGCVHNPPNELCDLCVLERSGRLS